MRAPIGISPFGDDEPPTFAATPQSVRDAMRDTPTPHGSRDSDEHTKLVAPRDKRTPMPQRVKPQSVPPPTPPPPPPPVIATPVPNAGAWGAQAPQPVGMAPMPMQPMPMAPQYPQASQSSYPMWGGNNQVDTMNPPRAASPTVPDTYERPSYSAMPNRPSVPQVAGFGAPKKGGIKPWMLVVGALIVAGLAFAMTRAFIGGKATVPVKPPITDKKIP
jgi:hypothetical protein